MSDERTSTMTDWPAFTSEAHAILRRNPPRKADGDADLAAVDYRAAWERLLVSVFEMWRADRRCRQSKSPAPMIAGALLLPTTGPVDLEDAGPLDGSPVPKRERSKKPAVSP